MIEAHKDFFHTHFLWLSIVYFRISFPSTPGVGLIFVIYLIFCPIKSLPLRHGQSVLMSTPFLCIELHSDRKRFSKIDIGL